MALSFTSTNRVNFGSAASLDNITAGTLLCWCYPTASVTATILRKAGGTHFITVRQASATALGVEAYRGTGTTNMKAEALMANFAAWGLNKDIFLAATWDEGGANSDQKLLVGDRATPAAEPSAYSAQTTGSGTTRDDSASNLSMGNDGGGITPFEGRLSLAMLLNRKLGVQEIREWQFNPHWLSGVVGFWPFGWNGTTNVQDLSGLGNVGTITGTTVAPHVPLGAWAGAGGGELPYLVVGGGGGLDPSYNYYRSLLEMS